MTAAGVIDTDVFSFVLKHDTRAKLYQADLKALSPVLSFMTVAELRRWAEEHDWGRQRRAALEQAVARCEVARPDNATVWLWASITSHRRRVGRPIACGDCWIAATAVRLGYPLVTHNASDFANVPDLQIITRGS